MSVYVFFPNLHLPFSGARLCFPHELPYIAWGCAYSSARLFRLIWHILRQLSLFPHLPSSPSPTLFLLFQRFGQYIQVSWESQPSVTGCMVHGRLRRRIFHLFSRTHWHFYFIGSVNLTSSAEARGMLWTPSSSSALGELPVKVNLKGSDKCCSSPEYFCVTQIAGLGQRPCLWHLQMVRLVTCSHHPLQMPCTSSFTCCKGGHVQGRCVFSPWFFLFQVSVMKSWTHFVLWMSLLNIISLN